MTVVWNRDRGFMRKLKEWAWVPSVSETHRHVSERWIQDFWLLSWRESGPHL